MTESDSTQEEPQANWMRSRINSLWNTNVYGRLLFVLVVFFISVAAIHHTTIGIVIGDILLFLVSFIIAHAFFRHHKLVYSVYVISAMFASTLDATSMLFFTGSGRKDLALLAAICYAALLLAAILILSRRLNLQRHVTLDMVRGGICVYLLVALLWYLFFAIVDSINPGSFHYDYGSSGSYDLLYFSFCTITTVGYGDIVPLHRLAKVLSNLEAMIGQMFPAVFIARLVSLYVISRVEDQKLTE